MDHIVGYFQTAENNVILSYFQIWLGGPRGSVSLIRINTLGAHRKHTTDVFV